MKTEQEILDDLSSFAHRQIKTFTEILGVVSDESMSTGRRCVEVGMLIALVNIQNRHNIDILKDIMGVMNPGGDTNDDEGTKKI